MSRYLILGIIFVLSLFLISGCAQKINSFDSIKAFLGSRSGSTGDKIKLQGVIKTGAQIGSKALCQDGFYLTDDTGRLYLGAIGRDYLGKTVEVIGKYPAQRAYCEALICECEVFYIRVESIKIINDKPFIESISPSEGGVGTEITIIGSGFDLQNDISFSSPEKKVGGHNKGYIPLINSTDSKTLKFTIPDVLGACPYTKLKKNEFCPLIGLIFPPGEYNISVINKNGESNKVKFTFLNST